jgi:hypothetical protein
VAVEPLPLQVVDAPLVDLRGQCSGRGHQASDPGDAAEGCEEEAAGPLYALGLENALQLLGQRGRIVGVSIVDHGKAQHSTGPALQSTRGPDRATKRLLPFPTPCGIARVSRIVNARQELTGQSAGSRNLRAHRGQPTPRRAPATAHTSARETRGPTGDTRRPADRAAHTSCSAPPTRLPPRARRSRTPTPRRPCRPPAAAWASSATTNRSTSAPYASAAARFGSAPLRRPSSPRRLTHSRFGMGSATALHTRRYKAFLARLRLARSEAKLMQEQVAEKLGRTQTWVSNSELGERRVDFVELEDLAAAYGKPLDWFGTRRKL